MRLCHFIFLALFGALPLSAAQAQTQTCPVLPPVSNMTLTFNDEFKTSTLDLTKWTAVAQGGVKAINKEQQAYVPGNVVMVPGVGARLRADKTQFWTHSYTSGEIITRGHFAQTYGYFEMKAKFPNGNGLWPAFWLLPNDGSWPPEIGVVEYIYSPWGKHSATDRSYLLRNLFWPLGVTAWRPTDGSQFSSNATVYLTDNYRNTDASPPIYGDFGTTYHTYGVAWYPGMMAFYVDGTQNFCWVEGPDTKGSVPNKPMFMLANLAIGAPGSWPGTVDGTTPFPANMDIVYIRAYQFANSPVTAPDPVAIMNPSVSPGTAHPGDIVTIGADVVIGKNALTGKAVGNFTIFNYDATQRITSIGDLGPSSYAANTTTRLRATYAIPDAFPPGIYTIYTCVSWAGAPPNQQCLTPNQAPAITVVASTAVNGVCGSSHGAVLNKVPTSNLCRAGTASPVSTTRPWSWTCAGSNDGAAAKCSASSR